MAENDKNNVSLTPTQLGNTIGAALKSSGAGDAIAKTLLKQLDISKLTRTIDSLSQSASSFKSAIRSISGGGGASGAADTKSKVSELNSLTAASKEADNSMDVLKENLEETAGDDNSAMGLAIKSFEQMIETNESLQKQIEETKNVYDLLGKVVQVSSKKSEVATVSSATKQVAANTTATASNGAKAVTGATANSMMLPPPLNVIALGAGIAAILGALAMLSGGAKKAGVSGSAPKGGSMPSPKEGPKASAASPEKAIEKQDDKKKKEKEDSEKGEKSSVTSVKENTVAVKTLTTSIIKQGSSKSEEVQPEPSATSESSSEPEASKPANATAIAKKEEKPKDDGAKQGSVAKAISKLANFNPGKSIQNAILSPMKAITAPFMGMKGALDGLKGLKASDLKQRLNPFAGFKEAFRTQVLGKPPSEPKKTAEKGATPAATAPKTAEPAKPAPESAPAATPETPEPAKTATTAMAPAAPAASEAAGPIPPPINGAEAKKQAAIEAAAIKSDTAARTTAQNAEKKLHDAKMGMLSEEKAGQTELMEQIRSDSEEKSDLFAKEKEQRGTEFEDKKTKNKGILGFLKAEGKMDEWKTKLTIKNHAKELASSAKKFAIDTARTAKGMVVKAASAAANVVKWAFALPFPLNLVALAAGGAAVVGGVLWARSMMKGGGGAAPKGQNPGEPKKEEEGPSGTTPSPEEVEGKGDKDAAKSMGSLSTIGIMMLAYERRKRDTLSQMVSLMKSIDKKLDNVGGGEGVNIINQQAGEQKAGDDKATNPADPFKAFRYAINLTRSV